MSESNQEPNNLAPPKRTAQIGSKSLIGLLVLSIAINIGLVGYVIGRMGSQSALPALAPPNAIIGRYLRNLEPDRLDEIRPAMRAHFKHLRPSIRAHRRSHRDLQQILRSEPLDVAALTATLTQLGELDSTHRAAQADSLTKLITALTPTERTALAEFMDRPLRRRDRHRAPPPPNHS